VSLKVRLIPCLLLKNGVLVRSQAFDVHQAIGYPLNEVERFNQWSVDELIYLDISRDGTYDIGRSDHKVANLASSLEILDAVSRTCFMPLTFGGGIRTFEDVRVRLQRGADKVAMNTAAFETPDLVTAAATSFGSQAIVVSIDVRGDAESGYEVVTRGGSTGTGRDPGSWATEVERLGAGEILLNSVDRDGTGKGYDLDLVREVTSRVRIPVIALGGVGTYEHFAPAVQHAGASAVAAANIFHFKELSDRNAKRALKRAGVDVRF
jgi:cyclase